MMNVIRVVSSIVIWACLLLATSYETPTRISMIQIAALFAYFSISTVMEFLVYHKKLRAEDPVHRSIDLFSQLFFPGAYLATLLATKPGLFVGILTVSYAALMLYGLKRNIAAYKQEKAKL